MLEWALSSAVLCAVLIALRYILRGRIGLRLQYALWALALLRLLLPVSFGASRFSVANVLQERVAAPVPTAAVRQQPDFGAYAASPADLTPRQTEPADPALPRAELRQAAAEPEIQRPEPRLTTLWMIGAAACLLWFTLVNLHFAVRLRRTRRAVDADCPLPVYVSPAAETPCLFGLLHPAVYLPPETAADPDLGHILAHEYTHYRHADQFWSLLRGLALALHWYDPLAWWAAFLSRRDGELACDEGTLRRLGEGERENYGRTLIRMTCARRPALFRAATTMTGSVSSLKERIRLIAKKPRTALLALAALVLIAALGAACTFTGAKEKEWDDERFIREAWPRAEEYAKAAGLELDPNLRSLFRLEDGKTVEVYFRASEEGQAVEVTFTKGEDGTWTVREDTPGIAALALLDYVRNMPVEADLSVPKDGALTAASEWLHSRILEWNEGRPAGDGVFTANTNRIVKARITGLTPMGTGAAGLTEGQDLYLLEYRLLPEDQEHIALSRGMRTEILDGRTWITEWGEKGQPYLLLGWKYTDDPLRRQPEWSVLGETDTMELFGVRDVSELADNFAKNYTALALERYMAEHQLFYGASAPEPTALPEGIVLSLAHEDITLQVGMNYRLPLTLAPGYDRREVTWSSDNPDAATVDGEGTVTPVDQGVARITASLGEARAECVVRVHGFAPAEAPPEPAALPPQETQDRGIALDRYIVILHQGASFLLTPELSPETAETELIWSSQDPEIAGVSREGLVTALSWGSTRICASAGGSTAECVVMVPGGDRMAVETDGYPVNGRGETYGGLQDRDGFTLLPDLQLAGGFTPEGEEISGYIRTFDEDNSGPVHPRNREETVAYNAAMEELRQKALEEGRNYLYTIPLYAEDGVTVLGSFRIGYVFSGSRLLPVREETSG